jgi:hypothetical protein
MSGNKEGAGRFQLKGIYLRKCVVPLRVAMLGCGPQNPVLDTTVFCIVITYIVVV